jgi:mannose-6-phosphate isomerase-like protein (cupin superfamily)
MAAFIGQVESAARSMLRDAGVRILRVDSPEHDEVMAEVLGEDSLAERIRMMAEPPSDNAAESEGIGAWHVNNVNEFETVLSGEGIVEFVTPGGSVAVQLGAGDIMAVERAEHRYRPLTPQEWALRFAGGAESELVGTDTGRPSLDWPTT